MPLLLLSFIRHPKLLFLFSFLSLLTAKAQTIRYVSTTGTNVNPASATSWATSTTNLQGAIDASQYGDQVWVAAGVYKPGGNFNTDRSISFVIPSGVLIYGSFQGNEIALSQRPALNMPASTSTLSTTLSGEIGSPTSTTDNSYHVIKTNYQMGGGTFLDGFVISGGCANLSGNESLGGGLHLDNSNITLLNCCIEHNVAINAGSGAFCFGNSPQFKRCVFRHNTGTQEGGAIIFYAAFRPLLENCILQNNKARLGGAILSKLFSQASLSDVLVSENTATESGGGIYVDGVPITIGHCTITNNIAASNGGGVFCTQSNSTSFISTSFKDNKASYGGGIYLDRTPAAITSCTLTSNSAVNSGGGLFNTESNSQLTLSSFANNSAINGAGSYVISSTVSTASTVFSANKAAYGGGIFASNSTHYLTDCKLLENKVTQRGGALYNGANSYCYTNKCLIKDNRSEDLGGGMYNLSSTVLTVNSVMQRNSAFNGGFARSIGSSLQSINCTLEGNSSPYGGAFYDDNSNLKLTNCILWNNGSQSVDTHGQLLEANYNLFESLPSTLTGSNNTLANSSPFSSTLTLQLTPCSPAINGANSATTPEAVGTTDQTGSPRFYKGGRLDIGALEYQGDAPILFTTRAGNWTDPTVWSCGRLPTPTDTVELRHAITSPADAILSALRVIYAPSGSLLVGASSRLQLGL